MNTIALKHAKDEKVVRLAKTTFVGAMLLFVLVALFTGYAIYSYLLASGSVRAAANRHAELDGAAAALKDVQRAVRGYVITGDPRFLAPCEKGREDAARAFANLRISLRDLPSRRAEIDAATGLADTLLGEMTREIDYVRQGSPERAMEIVKSGESNKAIETIDAIFFRLAVEEQTLLNSERLHAENNLTRALLFLVAGGGFNFVVIIAIFVVVQRQLRERTRLSDVLEKSENRLQLIIRSIQEGLTLSKSDGTFEIFNPRMRELTGYAMEEANASAAFRDLVNVDTRQSHPSVVEKEFETRGGDRKILRGCSRVLEQSGTRMLLTTYQDVTEERRAQEELRIQKTYFERLFDSMPEGVALIDDQNRIRNVNAAYEKIFGFSRSDILDRDFTTLSVPEGMSEEALGALGRVLKGEVVTFETRRKKKDGTMIDVSIIATPLDPGNGHRMSYGIYRDITERKQAEADRERLITELQQAVAEVKTLSGLLPICAWCKKVRDDQGYYQQIEVYITRNSDATFTHGICPECLGKFNEDLAVRQKAG